MLILKLGTLRNTKKKNGVPSVKLKKSSLYYVINRYIHIQEHRNTGTHIYQDRMRDQ